MIVKRWRLYLLTTVLVLVGIVVAVGLATRLGFGPLVDAVRRDPQRCLFADESTWDICKSWLPQTGAIAQSKPPIPPPATISKASTFLIMLSATLPS